MKILDVKQGSVDWLIARSGIPTASEFDALLTPKFKVKTGDGPRTYLCKKLAEAWQGGPLMATQGAWAMEQGQILETEAIPWYSLEFNKDVQRVGFITSDDGKYGCSPDGLVAADCGIEIKCPQLHTHVGYVLDGVVPDEYTVQVHGSMFVTGFPRWQFLSYRRHFPHLLITVERDEEIQEKIAEAIGTFQESFDDAWSILCDRNGGAPKRRVWTPPSPEPEPAAPYVMAQDDIIP